MALERAWPLIDDTRHAFDGVAADYDRTNTANPILRHMRQQVMATLMGHVPAPAHVLDLGCGPGTDATALAGAGYSVTAVDSSPAMTDEARRRAHEAGIGDRVSIYTVGIHELERLPPSACDAAYSNFGPLNCVPSLEDAARLIAGHLRPNGVLVASVIGRLCPWEIALYLSRGDMSRASLRFTRDFVGVPLDGRTVWTRYYTPRQFERAFAPAGFRRVSCRALGLLAPPPYLEAFARRRPDLVARLLAIDDRIGAFPLLRDAGDHFLIVMRKS